jgi:hypothetical protein
VDPAGGPCDVQDAGDRAWPASAPAGDFELPTRIMQDEQIQSGAVRAEDFVTGQFPVEQAEQAFAAFGHPRRLRARGHVKAVQVADEFGVPHETIRKDLDPGDPRSDAAGARRGGRLPARQRGVLTDSGTTMVTPAANLPHGPSMVASPTPSRSRSS